MFMVSLATGHDTGYDTDIDTMLRTQGLLIGRRDCISRGVVGNAGEAAIYNPCSDVQFKALNGAACLRLAGPYDGLLGACRKSLSLIDRALRSIVEIDHSIVARWALSNLNPCKGKPRTGIAEGCHPSQTEDSALDTTILVSLLGDSLICKRVPDGSRLRGLLLPLTPNSERLPKTF